VTDQHGQLAAEREAWKRERAALRRTVAALSRNLAIMHAAIEGDPSAAHRKHIEGRIRRQRQEINTLLRQRDEANITAARVPELLRTIDQLNRELQREREGIDYEAMMRRVLEQRDDRNQHA
jgi:predicted RND superfamily exporter protein